MLSQTIINQLGNIRESKEYFHQFEERILHLQNVGYEFYLYAGGKNYLRWIDGKDIDPVTMRRYFEASWCVVHILPRGDKNVF